MTELHFQSGSFDAVVALYSIIHVPRDEHPRLLHRIAEWLGPGGLFVATMSVGDTPGAVEEDWLGAPMYWSGYDAATNKELVDATGLRVEIAEVIEQEEDGEPVPFLWLVTRKPA